MRSLALVHHRALATMGGLAALIALPLSLGCYAPRMDTCRSPVTDFTGVTDVEIESARLIGGFESPTWIEIVVSARAPSAPTCIAVHSELWDGTTLVSTIDTPITATSSGTIVTTSPIIHYRASSDTLEARVTVLGVTVTAPVVTRRTALDTGPRDVGPDGSAPSDAGGSDAAIGEDGGDGG